MRVEKVVVLDKADGNSTIEIGLVGSDGKVVNWEFTGELSTNLNTSNDGYLYLAFTVRSPSGDKSPKIMPADELFG